MLLALEQKFGFVSKYYTVTDQRFLTHPEKGVLAKKNLHDDTIRIFRSELQVYDDANFLSRTCYVRTIGKNGFSTNLSAGFYFGCTTTMLAIQLAYYLGFGASNVRQWRNGRRARLRAVWETVLVRVQFAAP